MSFIQILDGKHKLPLKTTHNKHKFFLHIYKVGTYHTLQVTNKVKKEATSGGLYSKLLFTVNTIHNNSQLAKFNKKFLKSDHMLKVHIYVTGKKVVTLKKIEAECKILGTS